MANSIDPYYFSLCRIEQEAEHEISFLSSSSLKLDVLTQAMSYDRISDNDYLKLLQMNFYKYDKMDRKKAKRYCLIKMQMLVDAKKHPYKRGRFKEVNFNNPLRGDFHSFSERRSSLLQGIEAAKIKRFLWFDVALYVLLLSLFVYGLHFSIFGSVLLSLMFFASLYAYFYFCVLDEQVADELERDLDLLDPLMQELEVSRKNSAAVHLFGKTKKGPESSNL